jgi:hypothetical protein
MALVSGLWSAARRYRVLIWFVVGLFGLDRVIASQARRWDAYDPHPYRERIARCRQGRWDLLVVGGSPAMCGIDPAGLAGMTWHGERLESAYNLGLPLGTANEVWLAAEHGPVVPPRLMIYGATATDFNDSRRSSDGPRELMTVADVRTAAAARPKLAAWYAINVGSEWVANAWQLYYHRRGIHYFFADVADSIRPGLCSADAAEARRGLAVTTNLRTGDGYTRATPEAPMMRLNSEWAAAQTRETFPFMDRYSVGAAHLAALDRMLAAAERRGVPVVIVDLPVPADLDRRMFPAEFAAYRSALKAAAASRNVHVLWADRESLGITNTDFSDLIHLNNEGAAKVSGWIRRIVESGGGDAP